MRKILIAIKCNQTRPFQINLTSKLIRIGFVIQFFAFAIFRFFLVLQKKMRSLMIFLEIHKKYNP